MRGWDPVSFPRSPLQPLLEFSRASPAGAICLSFPGESREVVLWPVVLSWSREGDTNSPFHSKTVSGSSSLPGLHSLGSSSGALLRSAAAAGGEGSARGRARRSRGGAGAGRRGRGCRWRRSAEHTVAAAAVGSAPWAAAAGGCWGSCARCSSSSVSAAGMGRGREPGAAPCPGLRNSPVAADGTSPGSLLGEAGGWERGPPAVSGFVAPAPPVPSLAAGSEMPGCPQAQRATVAPSAAGQGGKRLRGTARGPSAQAGTVPGLRLSSPEQRPKPALSADPMLLLAFPACPPTPGARRSSCPLGNGHPADPAPHPASTVSHSSQNRGKTPSGSRHSSTQQHPCRGLVLCRAGRMGTTKPGVVFGLGGGRFRPFPRSIIAVSAHRLQHPGKLPRCVSLGALSLLEPGGGGSSPMVLQRNSRDLPSWFLLPCLPC